MSSTKRNARVLIADDDQSIRQLVSTILRREGLEVDAVSDGQEAIAQLETNEYAVILLDLMMPRLDGFGVIDHLKQHPPATKPVVLVVTAYADQKFKEVDANVVAGVLRKPFEVYELGSLVQFCVNAHEEHTQSDTDYVRDPAAQDVSWKTPSGRDDS